MVIRRLIGAQPRCGRPERGRIPGLANRPLRERANPPAHAARRSRLLPTTMILALVEGTIVATKKNEKMTGSKLLVVRPVYIESPEATAFKKGTSTLVAVDALGAGEGEMVLVVQGSSARLAAPGKDLPVDAVVVGIVDTVDVGKRKLFAANAK